MASQTSQPANTTSIGSAPGPFCPQDPSKGYEPQGYCAVTMTVDVARGAKPTDLEFILSIPKGVTLKDDGTVLYKPMAVDGQGDLWVGEPGSYANVTYAAAPKEGDTAVTIKADVSNAKFGKKVPWVLDTCYWTNTSFLIFDPAKTKPSEVVFKKGTALDKSFLKPGEGIFAPQSMDPADVLVAGYVAPRDLYNGDVVTLPARRTARFHGVVYTHTSDDDWNVQDTYSPSQQENSFVNPAVQSSGAGIGKDNYVYGAAIPGGRFLLDKPLYTASASDPTKAGIYPQGSKQKADGSWDYTDVPQWLDGEYITLIEMENGVPTGTKAEFFAGPAKAWAVATAPSAGSGVKPVVITSAVLTDVDAVPGVPEHFTAALKFSPATPALAPKSLSELNRCGGIDFQLVWTKKDGTVVVLDPAKQWPEGSKTTAGGGDHYWNGTRFAKGAAPAEMPNSSDTFYAASVGMH